MSKVVRKINCQYVFVFLAQPQSHNGRPCSSLSMRRPRYDPKRLYMATVQRRYPTSTRVSKAECLVKNDMFFSRCILLLLYNCIQKDFTISYCSLQLIKALIGYGYNVYVLINETFFSSCSVGC